DPFSGVPVDLTGRDDVDGVGGSGADVNAPAVPTTDNQPSSSSATAKDLPTVPVDVDMLSMGQVSSGSEAPQGQGEYLNHSVYSYHQAEETLPIMPIADDNESLDEPLLKKSQRPTFAAIVAASSSETLDGHVDNGNVVHVDVPVEYYPESESDMSVNKMGADGGEGEFVIVDEAHEDGESDENGDGEVGDDADLALKSSTLIFPIM
ncbi:hypothetical protein HDU76_005294, partial [Blyttiomyces sp. JEL0837]